MLLGCVRLVSYQFSNRRPVFSVVVVDLPAHVLGQRLVQHRGARRVVHGDVVFEAVGGEEVHEFRQIGDLHHARGAEGVQRIVGHLAVADAADDSPLHVVGREAGEPDRARLQHPVQRAEAVTPAGFPLTAIAFGPVLTDFMNEMAVLLQWNTTSLSVSSP